MELPQGLPVLEPIILRKLSSAPLRIVPTMLFVVWWVWSIIYVLAVCLVVLPHLCGASLFGCKKKGGGHRPIAVGEVLHRLTSKYVCWAVRADAIRILSPLQVGVGLPVGCEAIVHSVTSVQEDVSVPPDDSCTLLVDFSNAFNSVDREGMFRVVRARIPSMAAWLECCCGSQPLLHLGEHTILSCCGVQQGDPLGPLGFALALHPIIEKIKEEVPSLLINAWYLDDGTLCGSVGDLCSALAIIESEGPSRGLLLNRIFAFLWMPLSRTTPSRLPSLSLGVVLTYWDHPLVPHPIVNLAG